MCSCSVTSTCRWCTIIGYTSEVSRSSGSLRPVDSPEVMDRSPRTTRHAYRRRRPLHVMEPPVENIPVLTIQDPLAAAGAVVLDCRPPLLPVSMDISWVDMSAGRHPAVSAGMDVLLHEREPLSSGEDLLGLICPELGVAPLVDPGTDLEDERPTPVGSPSPGIDESVPLSATSGVDLDLLDHSVLTLLASWASRVTVRWGQRPKQAHRVNSNVLASRASMIQNRML